MNLTRSQPKRRADSASRWPLYLGMAILAAAAVLAVVTNR